MVQRPRLKCSFVEGGVEQAMLVVAVTGCTDVPRRASDACSGSDWLYGGYDRG